MPDFFSGGFVVREQAWHGKATLLDDWPGSVDEAWKLGYGWEPVERTLWYSGRDGELEVVDGRKALVRDDDESFLSDVGDGFTPVLNRTLLEILDVILRETGVRFDSVGSADGGREDTAGEALARYVDEKAAGSTPAPAPVEEPGAVIDLTAALEASLAAVSSNGSPAESA